MTFEAFGFAEPLSRALTQRDYTNPTPIQIQALPPQLEGRDLMAMAETGSGKTAAFLLPILQRIAAHPAELAWKQVGALILAPTRELALQIDAEITSLARNMNIRHTVVLGGVSKGPQINALKRGVHILVATPGRLLDHCNMRSCDLSGVQTLVLDEADRMFDMGFIRDIRKIAAMTPQKRRTAMFSATMPAKIRTLAKEMLKEPAFVDLSPKQMVVDRIDQKVMIVRSAEKQSRLHTILKDEAASRVIIFTRTKRGADRVAERLAMAGIGASAIHGNKAQNARQRALADFSQGHVRVLVATDIAARGIDVSNITHVINFDMPIEAETYVHRIGRTARNGNSGIAISLCDPAERPEITAIERLMKQKIEVIGDIGGETLPMPERRPHHAADAPRREGAHRKGPSSNAGRRADNRPDREQRGTFRGAPREDRPSQAGGYDPAQTAGRPERSERPDRAERPREHAPRPAGGRSDASRSPYRSPENRGPRADSARDERPREHTPRRDPRASEGKRLERNERSERPERSERSERAARSERPNTEARGPRSDAPRSNGPRSERPRVDHTPRAHAARTDRPNAPRAERPHGGSKPEGARTGEKNWNGQNPPKFLKQRSDAGTGAGRPRPKPAA